MPTNSPLAQQKNPASCDTGFCVGELPNPHMRVIGLTATTYRLDAGPLCSAEHFLNSVCYEIGIKELIREGFLCPLVSKASLAKVDTSALHVRGGEFVSDEVDGLMNQDALVEAACREIVTYTTDRRACLVFASSVKQSGWGRTILTVKPN